MWEKEKPAIGKTLNFFTARQRMTLDDEFGQFWVAYPRKRKRLDARKAFEQARRAGVTLDTMLTALAWQRGQSQWVRDDGQYIPYPASWLRAGSYDDEPDAPVVVAAPEFWGDICSREHGGRCRNRFEHELLMREEKAS